MWKLVNIEKQCKLVKNILLIMMAQGNSNKVIKVSLNEESKINDNMH